MRAKKHKKKYIEVDQGMFQKLKSEGKSVPCYPPADDVPACTPILSAQETPFAGLFRDVKNQTKFEASGVVAVRGQVFFISLCRRFVGPCFTKYQYLAFLIDIHEQVGLMEAFMFAANLSNANQAFVFKTAVHDEIKVQKRRLQGTQ